MYKDLLQLSKKLGLSFQLTRIVLIVVLYYRLFMFDDDHLSKLIKEIANQGVHDKDNLLTDPAYELIATCVPFVCVDIIPVRAKQIGIISRATGSERGKPAILGGRVHKNETISDAISRHLLDSFGSGVFKYHEGNSESHPFYVQQFLHGSSAKPPYGYDPTKHSVTMVYLVTIEEPMHVRNEASDFRWVSSGDLPDASAYNHHLVMRQAASFLQSSG